MLTNDHGAPALSRCICADHGAPALSRFICAVHCPKRKPKFRYIHYQEIYRENEVIHEIFHIVSRFPITFRLISRNLKNYLWNSAVRDNVEIDEKALYYINDEKTAWHCTKHAVNISFVNILYLCLVA